MTLEELCSPAADDDDDACEYCWDTCALLQGILDLMEKRRFKTAKAELRLIIGRCMPDRKGPHEP